jgi:hypothetical protein
MPGSRASVFGEAEDFQAALSADGVAGLLVTGHGQFRARLTQVELDRLRLTAVEETQPRIAFVTVPSDMVLVSFPIEGRAIAGLGRDRDPNRRDDHLRPRPATARKNPRSKSLGRHPGPRPTACPLWSCAERSRVRCSAGGAMATTACGSTTWRQQRRLRHRPSDRPGSWRS